MLTQRRSAFIHILLTFFVCLISLSVLGFAETSTACSNSTLKGNYGMFLEGSDNNGNVLVSLGQIVADGKGGLSGLWNQAISGNFVDGVTLSGTYKVNSNCTGTATLKPTNEPVMHLRVMVAAAGAQFDMIDTDSGNTQSGYAQTQGKAVCSAAGIAGTWEFVQSNAFVIGIGLGGYIAQVKFNKNGGVVLNGTDSVNGDIQQLKGSATYSISSDCTGTINSSGGNSHFVVVNGGHGMLILTETPDVVGKALGRR
jgi:hypothetical protein